MVVKEVEVQPEKKARRRERGTRLKTREVRVRRSSIEALLRRDIVGGGAEEEIEAAPGEEVATAPEDL